MSKAADVNITNLADLVVELMRTAPLVPGLTVRERTDLLGRAVSGVVNIQTSHDTATVATTGETDNLVHRLNRTARRVEEFTAREIGSLLTEAGESIKAALLKPTP